MPKNMGYSSIFQQTDLIGEKSPNLVTLLGNVSTLEQGCQMVYFLTKNPNLDKYWRELERKR
jgi:hypothetical protein